MRVASADHIHYCALLYGRELWNRHGRLRDWVEFTMPYVPGDDDSSAVLVVDDNPIVRANAVHLLQDLGFRVFDAYNGAEALQMVRARPEIDLLFVDVRMPGMSGPELAAAAQRIRPQVRIVFTSGYVDERTLPDEFPFVPKPWRLDQVNEAITAARSKN